MNNRFVLMMLVGCAVMSGPLMFAKDKSEKYQATPSIHLDRAGEKWAASTLKKLTPEEKVGQLFMIWVRAQFLNVDDPIYLQLRDSINKYRGSALVRPA